MFDELVTFDLTETDVNFLENFSGVAADLSHISTPAKVRLRLPLLLK